MKITSERTEVMLETFDSTTGERVGEINATKITEVKNYSIKRLNVKIWQDGMDWIYLQVATSKVNTMIFNSLKNNMNTENEIRSNITHLANEIEVDSSTIRKMIKRLIDIGFLHRMERGVYLVNPFVIKAKGQNNQTTENKQAYWTSIYGFTPTTKTINERGSLI